MSNPAEQTKDTARADVSRDQNAGWIAPPVDIFEEAEGVSLIADVPGITHERLNVRVEHEVLTLEGEADFAFPGGIEALYVDTRSTRYRRTFTLSGDLDPTGVSAKLKDGVVTVWVPKRAEAKPRRVEVKIG